MAGHSFRGVSCQDLTPLPPLPTPVSGTWASGALCLLAREIRAGGALQQSGGSMDKNTKWTGLFVGAFLVATLAVAPALAGDSSNMAGTLPE